VFDRQCLAPSIQNGIFARAYSLIASYLDDTREGPIPSLYLLLRYLNRFCFAEEGALRFTALDFTGSNVIVGGRVLYLQDVRRFVETIITEVKELLRGRLFFGLDIFDTIGPREWCTRSLETGKWATRALPIPPTRSANTGSTSCELS
jgi:hypothetical protein